MIGDKIKERRESLELTQEELAKRIGYKSKSTINKIEMGINDIGQAKINAFAVALECSVAYLMEWEDIKSQQNISTDEFALIEYYRQMSNEGKEKLIERATELIGLGYIKNYKNRMVE